MTQWSVAWGRNRSSLQGGGGHRPRWHFSCSSAGVRPSAKARGVGAQHHGAAVLRANALSAHASAAKAGVNQLTRALALEWGTDGVRLNAISPGLVDGTEGFHKMMSPTPQDREFARLQVPLRRFGFLDDIANLALFLSSSYASYISGAVVPCDGGGALESVKPALEAAGSLGRPRTSATSLTGSNRAHRPPCGAAL